LSGLASRAASVGRKNRQTHNAGENITPATAVGVRKYNYVMTYDKDDTTVLNLNYYGHYVTK